MLTHARSTVARLLTGLLLATAFLVAPASPAQAVAAPTSVKAVSTSYKAVALTWAAVPGAARYSVQYSTSSTMRSPKYWKTDQTYVEITGLSASKTYYLRVRVLDAAGAAVSGYSSKVSAKTKSSSSYPYLAPRVVAGKPAADLIPLSWGSRSSTAKYRVAYRPSGTSTYKTVTVSGTQAQVGGLAPAKTYYLKVRVLSSSGSVKSDYSPLAKVTTAAYTAPAPARLDVTDAKPTQLGLDWEPVSGADAYRIQYSTSATMSGAGEMTAAGGTSKAVSDLAAGRTYYLKVQALRADGGAISPYSAAVTGKTAAATSAKVTVASFNVGSAFASGPSWASRASTVARTIIDQGADVVGLQEASQGRLDPDVSYSQFDDLVDRLGGSYRLTNTHRYNCVNSITTKDCVAKDLGASAGTRIAYNSSVLALESQGSKLLAREGSSKDLYAAWAIFLHKTSGKRFFFASVHLQNDSSSTSFYDLRIKQTAQVIDLIKAKNPDKLPTYVVGDFNSGKWAEPSNAPYDRMVSAGYVDPLNNTYRSKTTTPGGIAGTRIKANCDSYNGYASKPTCAAYANGNYLDYIWVSSGVKVPEWETVVRVDSSGNFVGTVPSDHNMLRADTVLG